MDSQNTPNSAFGLYLLMEDSSSTIEWCRSEGKTLDKLFILLLSADGMRTTQDTATAPQSLAKLVSTYMAVTEKNPVLEIATKESLTIINYLVSRRVPLHCSLQIICEQIWDKLMSLILQSALTSRTWISLRRNIVRNAVKDLSVILNDRDSRKCFEEYLDETAAPTELTCLLSWRDTNKTLQVLDQYKRDVTAAPASGGKKTLKITNAPVSLSSSDPSSKKEYTDAYDALKVLLSGARQLQHRYFSQSQVLHNSHDYYVLCLS